jgi:hypothetical protein
VFVTKLAGNVARITWQPVGNGYYWRDVVRGGVVLLSVTGGDFTVATGVCLVNDSEGHWADDPGIPPAGDGYWYLVRTEQHEGCPSPGPMMSYNTAYGGQTGDRDYEILHSTRDCECYPPYCGLCVPPYCHLDQPIR